LVQVALDRLHASAERAPVVFSHDDYNPGNVLFDNGRLTGVVDWGEITREPRQAAVALYRHMLSIHPGGFAPERFLAHYEAATGAVLPEVFLWDVLYGLRGIGPSEHWVRAFQGHGLQITEQEVTAKSVMWIERALAAADL
jgi:aminoglycoside phosphotransferase (APT) family kinase protein